MTCQKRQKYQVREYRLLPKPKQDTAYTFSYTTDIDYVTVETKSMVARDNIVGH
jgi:hypothetical protein